MAAFEKDKFLRAVRESGLTKAELGGIFEVSRQHVYNMAGGATPRGSAAVRRVNIYSRALCSLIDKRVLPFPGVVIGSRRVEAIAKLRTKLYDLARP